MLVKFQAEAYPITVQNVQNGEIRHVLLSILISNFFYGKTRPLQKSLWFCWMIANHGMFVVLSSSAEEEKTTARNLLAIFNSMQRIEFLFVSISILFSPTDCSPFLGDGERERDCNNNNGRLPRDGRPTRRSRWNGVFITCAEVNGREGNVNTTKTTNKTDSTRYLGII